MSGLPHAEAWLPLASLLALGVTIGAYVSGIWLEARLKNALANPVLIAILLVGAALRLAHISYATYFAAAQPIHFLLGPATVALAVPLVRSLDQIRRALLPVVAALTAGALVSAVSGYAVARALGATPAVSLSMLPKGTTTPIAIGIAQTIGALPSLTAVLAIAAGILVAVSIDSVLKAIKIEDWRAIGLAAGTAGSGIGASRVIPRHPLAAAFAGIALGCNGLITALISPVLASWLRHW